MGSTSTEEMWGTGQALLEGRRRFLVGDGRLLMSAAERDAALMMMMFMP